MSHYSGESVRAFLPDPLPPNSPLKFEPLLPLLDRANQALGRLDGLSTLLPDTSLFLYLYVRKEAVLSSQIEGTNPPCRTFFFTRMRHFQVFHSTM